VPTDSTTPQRPAQPAFNADRALRNYQAILAGRKTLEQLTPTEQQEVMALASSLRQHRVISAADSCDAAYNACTAECLSTRTYFDYDSGDYRSTLNTDFRSKCEDACRTGQSHCQDEDDKDDKCDEFKSGCNNDCPTSLYDYRSGDFRLLTDAESKCEDACSVGANKCE
jgi:hypothetical protein